jgi:uncharacterized protein YeaO (DUF488 family)
MGQIEIRRVYDPPAGEGREVLVDRLWPRGVRKAALSDALWLKDVAPSPELRKWFGHRPERWAEFRRRYFAELAGNPALARLRDLTGKGTVTLLYAARDPVHNHAAALRDYLDGHEA